MGSPLKTFLEKEQSRITEALYWASMSYLRTGLELFQQCKEVKYRDFQPAIGILSISTELLLKTIIGKKMFMCLYPGLTPAARAMMQYPDSMPEGALPHYFMGNLRDSSEKMIQLDEAVSYLYQLFPKVKQSFKPHLSLLSQIRNKAVHSSIPDAERYNLERVAYIACRVWVLGQSNKLFPTTNIEMVNSAKDVVSEYQDERVTKVTNSMKIAKEKAKQIKVLKEPYACEDTWNELLEECPVCKNQGRCSGYSGSHEDGDDLNLFFYKESFFCMACGLELDDPEELELANFEIDEDISDRILDWIDDQNTDRLGDDFNNSTLTINLPDLSRPHINPAGERAYNAAVRHLQQKLKTHLKQ